MVGVLVLVFRCCYYVFGLTVSVFRLRLHVVGPIALIGTKRMNGRILRISGCVLAFAVVLAGGAAQAGPSLVIEANSGAVLHAEDATRPWVPASTTKMMSAYVALKAVREGRARLESPLQVSALAARQRPVKIHVRPGQLITLDNALKIMMVKSANDVAYVIAEGIGGSVDGFSAMMNAEAARLGMTESHFVNPNGWHASGHQSSAKDLAILAAALLREFPEYREYWGIGAVSLNGRVLKNTNGLIGRYDGAVGMKTGFVCASGFNVVAVAERGGRRLIAVVLGASSGAERTARAAQILDQAFASYGGSYGSVMSLPSSGYSAAPNICAEIRRRGVPLSDDYESDAAIEAFGGGGAGENSANPALAFLMQQSQPVGRSGRVTARSSSGRVVLGPRTEFSPVPVYLGRAPGNTDAVLAARGSVVPAGIPASAPASVAAAGAPVSAAGVLPPGALSLAATPQGRNNAVGFGQAPVVPIRTIGPPPAAAARGLPAVAPASLPAPRPAPKPQPLEEEASEAVEAPLDLAAAPAAVAPAVRPGAAAAIGASTQPAQRPRLGAIPAAPVPAAKVVPPPANRQVSTKASEPAVPAKAPKAAPKTAPKPAPVVSSRQPASAARPAKAAGTQAPVTSAKTEAKLPAKQAVPAKKIPKAAPDTDE